MDQYMELIGKRAKAAATQMGRLGQAEKNRGLLAAASALEAKRQWIIEENQKDIQAAEEKGVSKPLIDRLLLNEDRISGMAEGLRQVAALEDPVGEVLCMKTRPNGLQIGQKRVPMGVVGIIFESRPNVTADAFGLCFKTGNAVILRGGSDAIHSNRAITESMKEGLRQENLPEDAVILIENTDRKLVDQMLRMRGYIDVLIPRGGAGLISNVVNNSSVPVIETGTGNCHVYVDEYADLNMAADIIENAKTQRLGVCNACESLVIHEKVAEQVIPMIAERLQKHQVEMRGDEKACTISDVMIPATEEDWGTEYLDAIISVKVVSSLEQAMEHINRYNTKHSETIITENYNHALQFQNEVDAAAVYVNASTRFTDGFEFGFGAEIGISTQKLHARGPMGLEALTTTKYIIFGSGQSRP